MEFLGLTKETLCGTSRVLVVGLGISKRDVTQFCAISRDRALIFLDGISWGKVNK